MSKARRSLLPYALLSPGLLWLVVFFAVPLYYMAEISLKTGTLETGYQFTWHFKTYTDAISNYQDQLLRSFWYAGLSTLFSLLIAFPLAYVIAFRGGKYKNALRLLVILPVYAALERVDPRMLEAGYDLYAKRRDVVMRLVVPAAAPGIVAGILLTFIPAAGDFVNAELLGTPQQSMIGNVIQSRYLEITDYPTAAALSFTLMLFILIGIFLYARLLGAQNLTEAAI